MPPAVEAWSLNHWTAREAPLTISLRSFIVLDFIFRPMIHFELVFAYGVRH